MPETITGYNTFSAGTKARSTQVNTNFSNYRGTLLPIDPNTAAAAHLTYNLGSTEYRWDNVYFRKLNLIGATTTANLIIERDSAVTAGSFKVQINSVTVGEIRSTGTWLTRNLARTSAFSSSVSGSAVTIAASVLSFTAYGLGSIEYGLFPNDVPTITGNLNVSNNATAASSATGTIRYYLDGVDVGRDVFGIHATAPTAGAIMIAYHMLPGFNHYRFNVTAGGHTLYITIESNTSTSILSITDAKLMVRE